MVQLQRLLNTNFYLFIILGGVIFSMRAKKRSRFLLRLLGGTAVCVAACYVLELILRAFGASPALEILRAVVLFALCAAVMYFSYEYTPQNAAYVGVLGYTIQHMTLLLYSITAYYLLSEDTVSSFVFFLLFAAVYIGEFFAVKRNRDGFANINNTSMTVQSAIFLFGSIVLSVLSYDYIVLNGDLAGTPAVFIVSAFGIMMCVYIIIGLLDSFHIKRIENELIRTRDLWRENVRQYELSKKTVEVLNYRYHDLKSRMELALRDESAAAELTRALDSYDDSIRTGNEAMDVVLTEKSVLCRQNGIALMCIADGGCLDGMGAVEIYSILGNLIDNAIEYLKGIEDAEKKIIALNIHSEGSMDVIRIDNYLAEIPKESEGLPVTTKEDKESHGFGLKSVRYTLSKYNGIIRISTDNNIFSITIALPRQRETI